MNQLVCHEEIRTATSSSDHQQQQHLIVEQQQNGADTPDAAAAASPAKDDASPEKLPAKRPSPWRKTSSYSSNVESSSKTNKKKKKSKVNHHHHHHVYRDCISVHIPLSVTADLGIPMKHTRTKRVTALKRAFPSLKNDNNNAVSKDNDDVTKQGELKDDDVDDDGNKGETTKDDEVDEQRPKKKVKKLANVPQPGDFGNMIDYLEAKYVQGVMLENEEAVDDDDEGQGSVYSETSFLDDTDLQRTVAEQVLAHTTTTKLELLQDNDDDNAFFVNVGKLEVEETETTHEQYDPLQDTNDKKKSPNKRKRKKTTSTTTASAAASSSKDGTGKTTNGKKNGKTAATSSANSNSSKTNRASSSLPKKKKAKVAHKDENEKPNKKTAPPSTTTTTTMSADQVEDLQQISMERKAKSDELYQSLVSMIQSFTAEELPRRKTKDRVALICPEDKKPGDSILFTNPHVPGQRCKVTIPKNTAPGSTFKATVPVPDTTDDNVDYNKLNRTFYDALVDYAHAYDVWCDAEGAVRKARGDTDYTAHFEKRKKFDELIGEFPHDLKTPVDAPYIKKILRRARQNKSKREQTAQARLASSSSSSVNKSSKEVAGQGKGKPKGAAATTAASSSSSSTAAPAAAARKPKAATTTTTVLVPELSTEFATKPFDPEIFE